MRIFLSLTATAGLLHAQEKISYDDHVLPIFEQACLNCHNPDKTKGGLDLSNYAGAMKGGSSGKVVEPGDISSTLISCVKQTAEPNMPPEGEKLSGDQIALLVKWIEGGLLENKSSSARKPSKPKFETALRSNSGAKPEGPPPMPEHLLLEPPVITERASAVHAIAASPWAPLLAVTAQRQILLHHTGSLELIGILPFPEGDPISLAFTPDARYLIVGGGVPGKSGFTVTFDVTNGSRVVSAGREFDSILAADIRPSFDIVATGGPSKLLKLWNTQSGELIRSEKKHTDWITALDISPDGILLASGDRNGGVWVWEAETGNEFHTLRAHQAAITALAFRADSNLLASASEDGSVRFWEMNNGGEVKKIDAHGGGVTAFSFAKNGSFVTAGRDNKAKIWKSDFNMLREIKLPALATAAAVDWEGKRAFVADSLGRVHTFSAAEKGNADLTTFPTNPPSIATRIEQIGRKISELQGTKEPEIAALQLRKKAWSAAAINTDALKAESETGALSGESEDEIDAFLAAIAGLDDPASRLNAKRATRNAYATAIESTSLDGAHREEALATLRALDASVKNLEDHLREKELALTTVRLSTDTAIKSFVETKSKATRLRATYLQALK
jgi:mono/diheme cytochrome c family protein